MEASILIVSRNRRKELEFTLKVLKGLIDISKHEILVFLDGCTDDSKDLSEEFSWVKWFSVDKSIGASPARHQLYAKAKGNFLIGLDDDAHPLQSDFISRISNIFEKHSKVGIVAFQEIKGVLSSDEVAINKVDSDKVEYLTSEFIGCGFAIRKEVYDRTNGFPVWMDIYGEESCVSIEVISKGYDILFSNTIKVNHRVDMEARRRLGKNYFRFGKQLKNTTFYFLVYHPSPLVKILKLYVHNFKKYVLEDPKYFKLYFVTVFQVLKSLPVVLKYRQAVGKAVFEKMKLFRPLEF